MPVRAAEPADVDALVAMIQEFAVYEGDESPSPDRDALSHSLFEPPLAAEALIAETPAGEVAGFALFSPRLNAATGRCEIFYLSDLFVRAGHRGRGHGRALMARLAAIAAERGYTRIDWSVLDDNAPAKRFYGLLGAFRVEDRSTFRLGPDTIRRLAAEDGTR
jgi:ribosomal protein S18 acetylase RimI-like enzyme